MPGDHREGAAAKPSLPQTAAAAQYGPENARPLVSSEAQASPEFSRTVITGTSYHTQKLLTSTHENLAKNCLTTMHFFSLFNACGLQTNYMPRMT